MNFPQKSPESELILTDNPQLLRDLRVLEREAMADLTAALEMSRLDAEEAECQGLNQ